MKRELLVNKVASICMISCTNVIATRATIYTVTDITASVGGKGVLPLNYVAFKFGTGLVVLHSGWS